MALAKRPKRELALRMLTSGERKRHVSPFLSRAWGQRKSMIALRVAKKIQKGYDRKLKLLGGRVAGQSWWKI
jgi:hypothetical protein